MGQKLKQIVQLTEKYTIFPKKTHKSIQHSSIGAEF
jgi:5-bromo-4-chloroindolyl phosphate hydrolysis protein